jgi:(p)ppGpp synthase/HD superfamily hydrolase
VAEIPTPQLTHRFTEALEYAVTLHTEARKGTRVPYVAHLLGVTALVLGESNRFPVTEDMAIAALLHDAGEDKGGEERLANIGARFGEDVERMIRACSDSLLPCGAQKEDWIIRKKRYVENLKKRRPDALLISAADKLHNARAILEDCRQVHGEVWTRFKKGRDAQIKYFKELRDEFRSLLGDNNVVEQFALVINRIEQECPER